MDTKPPASLLGPTTDSDRRRWQLGGAQALVEILKLAAIYDLPPLAWTLGDGTGGVAGRVSSLHRNAAEMRSVFDLWADMLGLSRRSEFTAGDGATLLRAGSDSWTNADGRYRSRVYVMADIFLSE